MMSTKYSRKNEDIILESYIFYADSAYGYNRTCLYAISQNVALEISHPTILTIYNNTILIHKTSILFDKDYQLELINFLTITGKLRRLLNNEE